MAGETPITVVGNLADDPELRFTQSGTAVANLSIASTPRSFDRQSGEWRDGETLWMRCTVWANSGAENVAESFRKGDRVIATGSLVQRNYTDRDGNNRYSIELTVEEIGPSAKWAMTVPDKEGNRNSRSSGDNRGGGGRGRDDRRGGGRRDDRGGGRQRGQYDDRRDDRQQQGSTQYDDPWGSAPPPNSGGGTYDDEPPF